MKMNQKTALLLAILLVIGSAWGKARLTQKAQKGHPRTLIGSGKAAELKQSCEAQSAEGAVFVNELTGIQTRNLEQEIGLPVMDRSALILEIFARRARTRQAHLQVEKSVIP